MSITAFEKRLGNRGLSAVGAVTLLIVLGAAHSPARGQQDRPHVLPLPANLTASSSCPQPSMLPSVPLQAPRPGEGAAAEQRWRRGPDLAAPPVASVIESLQGNDAVVEVLVGQARLLTLKAFPARAAGDELCTTDIVVADDTIVECDWVKNRAAVEKEGNTEVVVVKDNPRLLRIKGLRVGVTQVSITTPDDQTYALEVRVLYDLELFGLQLKQAFPTARLQLFQIREHLAVEGEARSIRQVEQILQTIEAYLESVARSQGGEAGAGRNPAGEARAEYRRAAPAEQRPVQTGPAGEQVANQETEPGTTDRGDRVTAKTGEKDQTGSGAQDPAAPQIINLLRVPGVQQVMLQVRIAELNRTGLREIGADINLDFGPGNLLETFLIPAGSATVRGVFPTADLELWIRALRNNTLLSVLAEPNLVALSGQKADFLAGGEFPVPVPQNSGGGTTVTVEFKRYGVQLEFTPFVLEDDTIRLTVNSEESSPDYSQAILLNGYNVPGINSRRASTTVEMRQGQSLAIAGLLRVSVDANTTRIPGLGDLPYIGPLFSNTTHRRQEKELLILVTPCLVAPMNAEDVPCLPGEGLQDPNDLEFYLLNRIEGRTGRHFYPTREWDDPWHLRQLMRLERSGICGPVGFSTCE
ncbi:MAG: hypothetical protein GX575_10095 [Candidatus Anammoximicrobium sp.]|nr:hypothetical protein [Candidatus Anammoximicrobium sp.]